MKKGLLMVFTGNGKGKTTAAMGMALRSAGHGLKVCFIQFIKGGWRYGEIDAMDRFSDLIDFHVMGKGFTWKSKDMEEDASMAYKAWEFARDTIAAGSHHLIVLDEFTYVMNHGIVDCQSVLEARKHGNDMPHIVITGRYAAPELIAASDLTTEMQPIRHPFDSGVKGQKGIEF